jgi:hypothetical protein
LPLRFSNSLAMPPVTTRSTVLFPVIFN